MQFSLFYPVAVGGGDRLGSDLTGLDPALYGAALAELREQAVCADEHGWTSLMLAEHHFEVEGYQVTPNPLMLNVYLAQHTQRLRHGQLGLALPNWNPLRLAEDVAMADHLTGGRLDLGISRGYQSRSVGTLAQHYGVAEAGSGRAEAEARNREVFEEWFEVMYRSWTEGLFSYTGRHIQVPPPGLVWPHAVTARLGGGAKDGVLTQLATVPKPLQTPHPPLFTPLSQSPATVDWAARVGSTIVTAVADPAMIRGVFEGYAAAAAGYGREVGVGEYRRDGGVAVCKMLAVGATHEQAWETARQSAPFVTDWLGEFGFFEAWRLPGQTGPVPRTLEQMVDAGAILLGTPDEVGQQVEELRDTTGAQYLICQLMAGMAEHSRMLDTISLFGEHVISRLGSAPAPLATAS